MALLDKDAPSIDRVSRDQKAVSALSMIMATYYTLENTSERKIKIARKLIDAYNLFRKPDRDDENGNLTGAGAYGKAESDEKLLKAFNRNYSLGHELGIWTGKELYLSELALKVAKLEITITEYFDIAFLNLFYYKRTMEEIEHDDFQYVHLLFETLNNLDENFQISKETLTKIFFPFDNDLDNRNALYNYLKDTSYFIPLPEDKKFPDILSLHPNWRNRLQELKDSCNLEYKDEPRAKTQEYFTNKKNYAKYVGKIPENFKSYSDLKVSKNSNLNDIVGKNTIYYGAPGTGKSNCINKEIEKVYPNFNDETNEESTFVFRTTLHPEYTYTDFVGQVMPKSTKGAVTYDFRPGVFTKALAKAIEHENEGKPVYLVLEELSRSNVSAVFGDLFQLLDRKDGRSEYSITNSLIAEKVYPEDQTLSEDEQENRKIYIPNNLFILGTVNTSDQNVFVMDTAFKRRFEWKYVSTKPKDDENNPQITIINSDKSINYVKWHDFYQELNKYITDDMALGEDKQVGQFFIKFNDDEKYNKEQIQNKLLQYLWDDVQGAAFNSQKLFNSSISSFSDLYDKFGNDEIVFNDDFNSRLTSYMTPVGSTKDD